MAKTETGGRRQVLAAGLQRVCAGADGKGRRVEQPPAPRCCWCCFESFTSAPTAPAAPAARQHQQHQQGVPLKPLSPLTMARRLLMVSGPGPSNTCGCTCRQTVCVHTVCVCECCSRKCALNRRTPQTVWRGSQSVGGAVKDKDKHVADERCHGGSWDTPASARSQQRYRGLRASLRSLG